MILLMNFFISALEILILHLNFPICYSIYIASFCQIFYFFAIFFRLQVLGCLCEKGFQYNQSCLFSTFLNAAKLCSLWLELLHLQSFSILQNSKLIFFLFKRKLILVEDISLMNFTCAFNFLIMHKQLVSELLCILFHFIYIFVYAFFTISISPCPLWQWVRMVLLHSLCVVKVNKQWQSC